MIHSRSRSASRTQGVSELEDQWHWIRRSRLFVATPAAINALLMLNLAWGVVRTNVDSTSRESWPFRFVILDVAPTASLLAAFGVLMLARAQLARTSAPNFGYSWQESGSDEAGDIDARWTLTFYNGGPGHATVDTVRYRLRLHRHGKDQAEDWIPFRDLLARLEKSGICGTDMSFMWLGKAPIIPQSQPQDGFPLLSATPTGLAAIDNLQIQITAYDVMGDCHTLRMYASAYIPPELKKKIAGAENSPKANRDSPRKRR